MLEHVTASIRDFFNNLAGNHRKKHTPEIGMTWYISHERAIPHSYRGYSDGLSRLQVIGVNEDTVEIVDNVHYQTIPRYRWDEYYEDNLRRARKANIYGGGSIVPTYLGIENISEDYAESKRNPFVRQPFY